MKASKLNKYSPTNYDFARTYTYLYKLLNIRKINTCAPYKFEFHSIKSDNTRIPYGRISLLPSFIFFFRLPKNVNKRRLP